MVHATIFLLGMLFGVFVGINRGIDYAESKESEKIPAFIGVINDRTI